MRRILVLVLALLVVAPAAAWAAEFHTGWGGAVIDDNASTRPTGRCWKPRAFPRRKIRDESHDGWAVRMTVIAFNAAGQNIGSYTVTEGNAVYVAIDHRFNTSQPISYSATTSAARTGRAWRATASAAWPRRHPRRRPASRRPPRRRRPRRTATATASPHPPTATTRTRPSGRAGARSPATASTTTAQVATSRARSSRRSSTTGPDSLRRAPERPARHRRAARRRARGPLQGRAQQALPVQEQGGRAQARRLGQHDQAVPEGAALRRQRSKSG